MPRSLLRLIAAALAGFALSLAFEPVALPWLMPLAVAVLVGLLHRRTARQGWWIGLAFGVAFYFTHIWWMRAVADAAWVALAGIESLFYGLFGLGAAALTRRRSWPLWVPALWVSLEVWRSQWPFSGMPWGRLAFGVVDTPAEWALPWVGMVGVSLLVASLATWLAWLAVTAGARWHGTLALLGVVLVLAVPALHRYALPVVGERTVAAVQGDVPGPGNDVLYDYRQVTANHVDATVRLASDVARGLSPRPDFVLWPENSTALDPFEDASTRAGIEAAVRAIGVPVVVGAVVDDGPRYALNQGIVWNPGTGPGDRYTKWHPVPYGEYIPFRGLIDGNFGQLAVIARDMRGGTRATPLEVAGTPVADAICFDVAYDDGIRAQVEHGAQLLAVQTSNATFIFTDQTDQQFAITRLRAIETGKWTVVASTNGVTGVIDPSGHVVDRADKRTTAVLLDRVALTAGTTPGTRYGVWIGRGCLLASAVGLLPVVLAYGRARRRHRAVRRRGGEPA